MVQVRETGWLGALLLTSGFASDGDYLLVGAGIGEFLPDVSAGSAFVPSSLCFVGSPLSLVAIAIPVVRPHVLRIRVSRTNPDTFTEITNFMPNTIELGAAGVASRVFALTGRCEELCGACRVNPSTFQHECHECGTSGNGACTGTGSSCSALTNPNGRTCSCASSANGPYYGRQCRAAPPPGTPAPSPNPTPMPVPPVTPK